MDIVSIGQIARALDVPIHRVRYAIQRRGIRPVCRVGMADAYDRGAIDVLRPVLAAPLRKAG